MMKALPALAAALDSTDAAGLDAATGVTTTDLATKSAAIKLNIGASSCSVDVRAYIICNAKVLKE